MSRWGLNTSWRDERARTVGEISLLLCCMVTSDCTVETINANSNNNNNKERRTAVGCERLLLGGYDWSLFTRLYIYIISIYKHIMYLWITLANSRWLMQKWTKITERWWSIMFISWKDYYLPAIKTELLINVIYYSENLIFFILTSKRFSRNSQNCCRWVLHQHRRQSCWCTCCCCCWFKLLLL